MHNGGLGSTGDSHMGVGVGYIELKKELVLLHVRSVCRSPSLATAQNVAGSGLQGL